jgi:integrase/recombinase XerD
VNKRGLNPLDNNTRTHCSEATYTVRLRPIRVLTINLLNEGYACVVARARRLRVRYRRCGWKGSCCDRYRSIANLRGYADFADVLSPSPQRVWVIKESNQEANGRMRSTVARRLSTLGSFYRYCHVEGILERDPAANVRRPKVDVESRTLGLDRNELGGLLVKAGLGSARDHVLNSLLALNGLRISEALNADITSMDMDRGHRTLAIVRKGGKHVTIPLAPRTGRTLDLYIDERTSGPIFLGVNGQRMDRYAADRIVKRLTKRAGITKRISPHSLRHSFITAALDAGVPLRDVQEAASHADPRTTMRYDRARQSLDRHATYIVAAFVAGAARSA